MDTLSLTTREAGYILDRSPKGIDKAIDEGIIRPRSVGTTKPAQRLLGAGELRFLGMVKTLHKDLTRNGQKRLYNAVRDLPSDVHVLRVGNLVFDLAEVDAELAERLRRLDSLRRSVETGSDGDVIRGTTISVHLVAALARGQTAAEIVEDYPELTPDQIANASEYARAFPKVGRPYPTRSFKRMLEDAAVAGVFDEDDSAGNIEPRLVP